MALTFVQSDDETNRCTTLEAPFCSGVSTGTTNDPKIASVGGTPGSVNDPIFVAASATQSFHIFTLIVGSSVTWGDGTWTVNLNCNTANMNLTITGCHICRVSSACANQETIGNNTGLSISLGTTGVKNFTVSGSAVTPSVGDKIVLGIVVANGAMSDQSSGFTPNQNIDSPFTAVTPSLLWDRFAPMRPHLVRKMREFFLGGLPPKLAKLRMMQNAAGLYVPSNDPEFRKAA